MSNEFYTARFYIQRTQTRRRNEARPDYRGKLFLISKLIPQAEMTSLAFNSFKFMRFPLVWNKVSRSRDMNISLLAGIANSMHNAVVQYFTS